MKKFIFLCALLLLSVFSATAQLSPPRAATQTEVNTGTSPNTYVSPLTLAGSSGSDPNASVGYARQATNDSFQHLIGGSNAPTFLVSGSEFHADFSNATAFAVGQIGIATAGTGFQDYLAPYMSTGKGDFKHAFSFPTGIGEIGDPLLCDSNVTYMSVYLRGSPAAWATNSTGDNTVDSANMNTYSSGSGFNCDIVTNDPTTGRPSVWSRNSVQFMYVPTNAPPGINKTNQFGGYHGVIANYNNFNMGFLLGGPMHIGAESGIPNHYLFGVLKNDSVGNFKGQLKIPVLTAGVSVPDDPNDVDLAMFDEVNAVATLTNTTLIGASATYGPFTVNQASSINVTNLTVTATFNASSQSAAMNLNSTNVTVGVNGTGNVALGSFGRLKINGHGDTANGDIFNSNGSGLSVSGANVFLSAGANGIFMGTASYGSFTNDLRALSITVTNASSIPTNTANLSVNTNDLVPGAINTGPNSRFSVSVPTFGTATLAAGFYGALMYSNAANGTIYTADSFSIPAGLLNADTATNVLTLPDANPNSLYWITNTVGGQNIAVTKNNSTLVSGK